MTAIVLKYSPRFELCAGNTCLDFLNTVDEWGEGKELSPPSEFLLSISDVLEWSHKANLISHSRRLQLDQFYASSPAKAAEICLGLLRLRQKLRKVFISIAEGQKPAKDDFQSLSEEFNKITLKPILLTADGSFQCPSWLDRESDFTTGLQLELLTIGYELLISPQLKYLKTCKADNCGWLFLDTSKNHKRCWCNMQDCGNRAKARRFYKRNKNS